MKQRTSGLPFDDVRELAASLPELNEDAERHTLDQLGHKPSHFADLCGWFSACTGRSPSINRPLVTLFAGTHSLENSLDGGRAAGQLLDYVTRVSEGSAYVNRLCHQHDVGLKVFDLALQLPVDDISQTAALDEKSCAGTIAFGMEAIAGGTDVLCIAAHEEQSTISALAILSIILGASGSELMDLRSENFEGSRSAFDNAIAQTRGYEKDGLEVLRRLGGRETAAICGAILAARSQHIAVLLQGVTAMAAASVLHALEPGSLSHCRLAVQPSNPILGNLGEKMGLAHVIGCASGNRQLVAHAAEALVLGVGFLKSAGLMQAGN